MSLVLAADIGGTNSRFGLYAGGGEDYRCSSAIAAHSYKNADFSSFVDIVKKFIGEVKHKHLPLPSAIKDISVACIAVAAPVPSQTKPVKLTNTNLTIDPAELKKEFGFEEVQLLNDFVANSYGLLTLEEKEKIVLQNGAEVQGAPIVCIGAGTGLGECYLTHNGNEYVAHPSEGGHTEFPPRNDEEIGLLKFLLPKHHGRVSVERVVSGKGIFSVYEFLASEHPGEVNSENDKKIRKKEAETTEGASVIGDLYHQDKLCKRAIDLFLSAYGSETGNLCLKTLPYGGVYIAGGIAAHHVEKVRGKVGDPSSSAFMEAFASKGRLSVELEKMKVILVTANDLGLRGAHFYAHKLFCKRQESHTAAEKEGEGNNNSLFYPVLAGAGLCLLGVVGLHLFSKE